MSKKSPHSNPGFLFGFINDKLVIHKSDAVNAPSSQLRLLGFQGKPSYRYRALAALPASCLPLGKSVELSSKTHSHQNLRLPFPTLVERQFLKCVEISPSLSCGRDTWSFLNHLIWATPCRQLSSSYAWPYPFRFKTPFSYS